MEEQLGRFGFYLPPNVQRHFIKSELQENGCRIEAIELLLGHWHLGQEGWFDTSALSPLAFREELEKHLPPLLLRLGLSPLPGLQKPPSARCAPAISPADERGSAMSQATAEQTQERLRRPWRRRIAIHPPGQIWQELVKREPCDQPLSEMFDEQQQIVLAKLQRLQPDLYRGAVDLQIPDEALRSLLRRIRSKGLSPRQYAKRLNFVFDGLERGAERLNWRVNLPSRPFFVSKGNNRMRPAVMEKMQGYRKVEQAFLADLAASGTVSAELELARILVSAILYGGLNHRCWAQALLPGLSRRIYQWQEMLWVDLWAQPPEESPQAQWLQQRNAAVYRRWLADPTTQLLIYRWLRYPASRREAAAALDLETIYDGYRRHLQKATGVALPQIKSLLRWGNAWATLHLPPFLSAYAANNIASACLPDPAWLRVLTGNHYPTAGRPGGGPRKKTDSSASAEEQIKRLREVCRAVREQGAATSQDKTIEWLRSYVREHGEHLCHTNHLLVAWMIQLLSPRRAESERRQKEPEKASTAASYPLTFARALLHVTVKLDLTSLDEDEFRNVFGAVVDSIAVLRQGNAEGMGNLTNRRADYIVERLNQFLGFLQVFHGTPGVLIVREGQKSSLRGTAEVRANLMTVTEFGRLKRMLQGGPSPLGRTQRMTLVAAILAFWGGLRAAEIQGLQIGDVQGDEHLELLVRRNGFREVKSEASTRRIPLFALLPKADLETVRQWHAFRSMEPGATASAPLFSDSPGDILPCSRESLLGPLAQACKQVTGDQGTVIHTLRHSFATWMLTSLVAGNTGSLGSLPAFWTEESFGFSACERKKTLLLENETLGRKALYATAALLGHSDTTTAMASYIHLCDWLLWQHLRHPGCAPPLTAKALSKIAGCSVPNGYKLLQSGEHPLLGATAKMARGYAEILKHPLEDQRQSPPRPQKTEKAKRPFPPFDEALNQIQSADIPKKKAITPETLITLQHLYEKIANIGQPRKAATSAKLLLAAYRAHDQAFQFSTPEDGSKVVELLRDLGITFSCRYYPSRWREGADSISKCTTQGLPHDLIGCPVA
ncbi:MAG: site-specific integrase [Zoogloea oleivorans]|jgi:integrase|uniref:site-specific integrase n=1 Tax=Zoogloea oleivorans TaxID=1552750 RepID=UPI002A3620F2|nr:site-specific integrase [Zoogloea oleivorans]MDY0038618.1 site-specific integrase [Zoogloea oleivorans]